MEQSPVARGVLIRIGLLVVMLPLLAALGGCSLFGIATKGNLNELADQQDLQHQQLQGEVRESEQKIDVRVTEVEDKTRQLDQNLIRYETEIQSAKLQLQSIKLDLDVFEEGLDRASTDSKQALRIQYDAILSERDRLRQRLNELDSLILSWEQQRMLQPEGTMTPVPSGLIIPEKQLETGSTTSAASASNETSVWENRKSGSSSR
jgi:septal ring factor EnvC (AmiA/AmiB activator)